MKKNIFKLLIFILMGSLTTSCFGDLDTMPLDETQLVGEKYIVRLMAIQVFWLNVTALLS